MSDQLTANQLAGGQNPKSLKNHVRSRFNSHKNNFASVLGSKDAIINYCSKRYEQPFAQTILRNGAVFWPFLERLVQLLEPFDEVSHCVCIGRYWQPDRGVVLQIDADAQEALSEWRYLSYGS